MKSFVRSDLQRRASKLPSSIANSNTSAGTRTGIATAAATLNGTRIIHGCIADHALVPVRAISTALVRANFDDSTAGNQTNTLQSHGYGPTRRGSSAVMPLAAPPSSQLPSLQQVRYQSIWSYLTSVIGASSKKQSSKPKSPPPKHPKHPKQTSGPKGTRKRRPHGSIRPKRQPGRGYNGDKPSQGYRNRRGADVHTDHDNHRHRRSRSSSPPKHRRSRSAPSSYRSPRFDVAVCSNPEIEEIKKRLLNDKRTPMGSFRATTWQDAERVMRYLVETDQDSTTAFVVMDRCARERDAADHITFDLLTNTMTTWLNQLKDRKKMTRDKAVKANGRGRRSPPVADNDDSLYVMSPASMWKRMEVYQRRGMYVDDRICLRVIEGTAQYRSRMALDQGPLLAETILNFMLQRSKFNPMLRPSTSIFNAVLQSWVSAEYKTPDRTDALLNQLTALFESGWGDDFMPDTTTYRRAMLTHAHQGNAERVEEIFAEMYTKYIEYDRPEQLKPTKSVFSLILFAWSKSRAPHAAERATALLERMIQMEESGKVPDLSITAREFNIVMICWCKLRTKEASKVVEAIFNKMLERGREDPDLGPSGSSYSALLGALCQHDPQKAAETLSRWDDDRKERGIDMIADARLTNQLIDGLCASDDGVDTALKILNAFVEGEMGGWTPTAASITLATQSLTRKGTQESPPMAEKLIRNLMSSKKNDIRKIFDVHMSSPVIMALAKHGDTERAVSLLNDVLESHVRKSSASAKRSMGKVAFNGLLRLWSTEKDPELANSAEELLLTMEKYKIPHDDMTFPLAWKCRENSGEKSRNSQAVVAFLDKAYFDAALHLPEAEYKKLRENWMDASTSTSAEKEEEKEKEKENEEEEEATTTTKQ